MKKLISLLSFALLLGTQISTHAGTFSKEIPLNYFNNNVFKILVSTNPSKASLYYINHDVSVLTDDQKICDLPNDSWDTTQDLDGFYNTNDKVFYLFFYWKENFFENRGLKVWTLKMNNYKNKIEKPEWNCVLNYPYGSNLKPTGNSFTAKFTRSNLLSLKIDGIIKNQDDRKDETIFTIQCDPQKTPQVTKDGQPLYATSVKYLSNIKDITQAEKKEKMGTSSKNELPTVDLSTLKQDGDYLIAANQSYDLGRRWGYIGKHPQLFGSIEEQQKPVEDEYKQGLEERKNGGNIQSYMGWWDGWAHGKADEMGYEWGGPSIQPQE